MLKKQEKPKDIQCLNCQTLYSGWFCPECGQKAQTKRLTTFAVIRDFLDALSDSDRGFLKTCIDLSQHPGNMLQDYLAGKRKRYLSAGKYTFLFVVLFTLNISLLEKHYGFFENLTTMIDQFSVTQDGDNIHLTDEKYQAKLLQETPSAQKIENDEKLNLEFNWFGRQIEKKPTRKEFLEFIKFLLPKYHKTLFDTLKVFLVLWIPVFSVFSFFFFRKQKLNFAEHITINSFVYSQLLLISILLSAFYWLLPSFNGTTLFTTIIATTFYLFFSYLQFFSTSRRRLLKTILSVGFSGFAYLTLLFALVLSQIAYVAILNIDQL